MIKSHHIPMSLRAAYLSMHRQTNAHLAPFKVTADQFVCLVILDEEDGITQKELVRRSTSDPNTIRAMLVLLEKRGLVLRLQHPTDGRARRVFITHTGRQLLDEMVMAVQPVQDWLTDLFQVEEVDVLLRSLQRISQTMKK